MNSTFYFKSNSFSKKFGMIWSFCLIFSAIQAQIYDDYIGAGHFEGVSISTSSNTISGENAANGNGLMPDLYSASRFLGQATLGADYETIEEVAQLGFTSWLDQQMSMPIQTNFKDTTLMIWDHFIEAYIDKFGATNVEGNDQVLQYWFYWRMAWWNNILKSEDLLRQRVAMALSQIFVVSEKSNLDLSGPGLADFYDKLYQHSFGNYRDLLFDITMHPAMGSYLSHINNPKSDPDNNIHPDENYAREIMQLFSIGLFELNPDGTRKVDNDGEFIPTYDNNDIKEFAKIFTGLAPGEYFYPWQDVSGIPVEWGNPFNFNVGTINMTMPMQMMDDWHEQGAKNLLNGEVVPAGQTGMQDINDAIDNLFNHPNVGPFLSKLLIQRLIKSNPTPEYVERMTAVFENNGNGERGDLGALVRAILLDPEARNCSWLDDPHSAKMRSPLLRATQISRAFNANNQSGKLWNWGFILEASTQMHILASPSVFNFYLPEYQPNGDIADADLFGPEFQIHTSATAINWINLMLVWFATDQYMFITTQAGEEPGVPELEAANFDPTDAILLDLTDELELANDPEALVDRLDLILTGGLLSQESKDNIVAILDQLQIPTLEEFVIRTAMYLVTIAPDYVIQK